MSQLKVGTKTPDALMFDKPLVEYRNIPLVIEVLNTDSWFDFTDTTKWEFNTEQPSDGITIEAKRVTITKFKPNVPILRSKFSGTGTFPNQYPESTYHDTGTPNPTEICSYASGLRLALSGFNKNQSLFNVVQVNRTFDSGDGPYNKVYYEGVVFTPNRIVVNESSQYFRQNGNILDLCLRLQFTPSSEGYPADNLKIRGDLNSSYGGYAAQGYFKDTADSMVFPQVTDFVTWSHPIVRYATWHDWNTNAYWQLNLTIYSSAQQNDDGYLEVVKESYCDPTTVESYSGYVMSTTNPLTMRRVWDKPKTIANTLIRHGCAALSTTGYEYDYLYKSAYQAAHPSEFGGQSAPNTYLIVDDGDWLTEYDKIRYPVPSDLEEKIAVNYPIKFRSIQQDPTDKATNYKFWENVYNYFYNNYITDPTYAYRLFCRSSIEEVYLNFKCNSASENSLVIDLSACFDSQLNTSPVDIRPSKIKSCTFNIVSESGKTLPDIYSFSDLFRYCNNLTELNLLKDGQPEDNVWKISQFSGAFEACSSLTSLPSTLVFAERYDGSFEHSTDVCQIAYAFEASGLNNIGNGEEIKLTEWEPQAFRNCPNLTDINLTLDMKYIYPVSGSVYQMFSNSPIESINLKNLNKGSWVLDGSSRSGYDTVGNLTELNASSIIYLFNNLYDLTSNTASQIENYKPDRHNSFKNWSIGSNVFADFANVQFYRTGASINTTFSSAKTLHYTYISSSNEEKLRVNINGSYTDYSSGNLDINIPADSEVYISCINADTTSINSILRVRDNHLGKGEVSSITAASLYCPDNWRTKLGTDIDTYVSLANSRGWTVYFGNIVYMS